MQKNSKMKKVVIGALTLSIGLGGLFAKGVPVSAMDFSNMNPIQGFPDALMVDYVNKDYKESDKAPSDYKFFAKFLKDTKVEVFGVENQTINSITPLHPTFDYRKIFHLFETRVNQKGKFGVWYRNVGKDNGRIVDVKYTAMDWDVFNSDKNVSPVIGFHRDTRLGFTMYGLNSMTIKEEYFDHETGKKISVKTYSTLTDVDQKQGFELEKKVATNLYVSPTSPLVFKETPTGYLFFDPDNVNADAKVDQNIYDNGVGWNQDYMVSYRYEGSEATKKYYLDHESLNHNPDLIGYSTAVGFDADARKPVPTEISKPEKVVSDVDEKDVTANSLTNLNEVFTYEVSHYVADEFETFFYDSYAITDQLEPVLDIKNVKVLNEAEEDVTKNFDVKIDTETNKVIANAKNVNKQEFYGHTYTLFIDTKIKKNADLTPYIQDGKTSIPNTAKVVVDGKDFVSNEVNTTPPDFNQPVVEKTVSDADEKDKADHASLLERSETIKWDVHYSFGNTTSNWDSAVLLDVINPFLDILNVQVTDMATGEDVNETGKLVVDKETNEVRFEIAPVNGTYDYLVGKAYALTINTKVKTSATDEDLKPFMDAEGIPNVGLLNFETDGKMNVEKSNVPTVDVPKNLVVEPVSPKKETPKTPVAPVKEQPKKAEKVVPVKEVPKKVEPQKTAQKTVGKIPKTGDDIGLKWVIVGAIVVMGSITYLLVSRRLKKNKTAK
ncbi:isopeptide-forming domain-containing fimbrial protein [Listeria booriae]|uniref:isopeptide-forming domain-containing fimbrial protein n=1 Tax=Listeria booriae TaxID=1552123 RepID=UPI001627575E|nr:isopeptide-forming domain-containing fimbrial protein [Listeria booriae]MBC2369712.1 isopeptide-forming domain-containing fimbrial protein [Listeria booriae]